MKIAFVANTCWNIYNFRKGLVHHFLTNGDDVLVLAPEDEYSRKICDWGVRWIDTPLQGTGANPFSDLNYLRKLSKIFSSEKPEVILAYTIKANIYSSLAGKFHHVPVICNVSGLGTVFLVEGVKGKIALLLYKLAFRFSKHIFFQNEDDKKLFTSIVKVENANTGILPGSGIDLELYKPVPFEEKATTSFVMISRVIIEKGVREYAEAASFFKSDKNVTFTLIGKFDEEHSRSIDKRELNRWIESGWIKYLDHTDDIIQVINKHDAVVLPSYREGMSRTLLEGAALGRPLIATNVPGCREVVKDGYNGFLCDVKSANSLLGKLKLFLSLSKQERKELAVNSRTLVEKTYDERIVINMYDDVIRRIIH
ncbi:glycosyltransferase family 4 protein [Ekhidna sp.]|uniref:glycosyltransferase family 4 protein n=1 Tax=Ekhidna sp. TaxID=2608089 RepID=UPI003298EA9C